MQNSRWERLGNEALPCSNTICILNAVYAYFCLASSSVHASLYCMEVWLVCSRFSSHFRLSYASTSSCVRDAEREECVYDCMQVCVCAYVPGGASVAYSFLPVPAHSSQSGKLHGPTHSWAFIGVKDFAQKNLKCKPTLHQAAASKLSQTSSPSCIAFRQLQQNLNCVITLESRQLHGGYLLISSVFSSMRSLFSEKERFWKRRERWRMCQTEHLGALSWSPHQWHFSWFCPLSLLL